jgi:hypothetical protein
MQTTSYQCDRCGTDCTTDPARNHLALVAGSLTRGTKGLNGYDLCGPCSSALAEWIGDRPEAAARCFDPTETVQS